MMLVELIGRGSLVEEECCGTEGDVVMVTLMDGLVC